MAKIKQEIVFRLGFPPVGATVDTEEAKKHIVFATKYELDDKGAPKKYVMDEEKGEPREFDPKKDDAAAAFIKPIDGWVRMYVDVDTDAIAEDTRKKALPKDEAEAKADTTTEP